MPSGSMSFPTSLDQYLNQWIDRANRIFLHRSWTNHWFSRLEFLVRVFPVETSLQRCSLRIVTCLGLRFYRYWSGLTERSRLCGLVFLFLCCYFIINRRNDCHQWKRYEIFQWEFLQYINQVSKCHWLCTIFRSLLVLDSIFLPIYLI